MSTAKSNSLDKKDARFKELEAFKKLEEIEVSKARLQMLLEQKATVGISPQLNFMRYLYLDFIKVFLMMIDMAYCGEMGTQERIGMDQNVGKKGMHTQKIMQMLLGDFLGDLIYNTEQIVRLRRIAQGEYNGSQAASFWIPSDLVHHISELLDPDLNWRGSNFIKTVEDRTKAERYIIMNWMRFLGLSEEAVYACLVPGFFSGLTMRRISYCLGMRALLTYGLEDNFRPFLLSDFYRGRSGLLHLFDGVISFTNTEVSPRMYLTKTCSLGVTGISIINDFCFALKDVEDIIDKGVGGILFVPGYPTSDTLRMELFWNDLKGVDVTVLYLADFYELFKIWDRERIERFLIEKTK